MAAPVVRYRVNADLVGLTDRKWANQSKFVYDVLRPVGIQGTAGPSEEIFIMAVEIADRITVDQSVRFGKPVIKGTRVPVSVIVGQAAAGMTHREIAEDYGIGVDDVLAALRYAHAVLDREEVGILAKP